ncbi:hypothetical protein EG832_10405 [bacterium]|nr:hypothetical protein [bacterium]
MPNALWESAKESLKKLDKVLLDENLRDTHGLDFQFQAMDIPAIGRSQLDRAIDIIADNDKKVVVVLAHHNPLPTLNLEIRPYASLVDAGQLIFNLMRDGRRAFILHGHTHIDSALIAISPDQIDAKGFVSVLGCQGLTNADTASVCHIEIGLDENEDFLFSKVTRFVKIGADFLVKDNFYIFDLLSDDLSNDIDIDRLQRNRSKTFKGIAADLDVEANEELAERLLKCCTRRQLKIDNIANKIDDWIITRC